MRGSFPRLLASAAFVALFATACATNPATGKRQISLVGERQEVEMGREAAEQVGTSIGLYSAPQLNTYVDTVGRRLAAASERPQLDWSFQVVDDPAVNAFALPGGYIYVTRGLLAHLNSEAELAAVLGHEIGHVTARHSVNQISRAQLATLGLGVGMILKPELQRFGQIGQAGLGLMMLKYGRDDENQADELGLRYTTKASYDPGAMSDVMRMLGHVSESENSGRVPNWLSTHPNPADRAERVTTKISEQHLGEGTVQRDAYLRRIDGLVFGPDPREGFFRESAFYHPEMAFQMEFPRGFETQNQKQSVGAISTQRDAVVVVTLTGRGSADAAAREFFAEAGVERGSRWRDSIHGLPAVSYAFAATAGQVPVRGLAAFVEHNGRVFQILGYSAATVWSRYDNVFEDSIESFARLTDRRYLNVEPLRLKIVPASRLTSLDEIARNSPVDRRTLQLINGVEGSSAVARPFVKTVVGDELAIEIMKDQTRRRTEARNQN